MTVKQAKFDAGRVLAALGRIGYNPVSAILDIVDNSVSAGAAAVVVSFSLSQSGDDKRKRTLIDSVSIVDNGGGMDEAGIDNALSLGSSEGFYAEGTLSKFGMGLKSAASSLGGRLRVTSRVKGGATLTAVMDQTALTSSYEYVLEPASDEEASALDAVAGADGAGTVVHIDRIHHSSMPRAVEVIEDLKRRAGVIYYYYIKGEEPARHKVSISVEENGTSSTVEAFDPLFLSEIDDADGDLDERNWSGLDVRWITRPQRFQLDTDGKVWAAVEISQLPHPPSVATFGEGTQAETRSRYNIGAGQYGFYIYRNGRLIAWADSLGGRISQDQDSYSFRGRILLDSDADDILNLDVTKSRIHLSEIAKSQLDPIVNEAKKKSIGAWRTASAEVQRKTDTDPHAEINAELDRVGDLDEKGILLDEQTASEEERDELQKRRGEVERQKPADPVEAEKLEKQKQRVQYVDELDNNQLWERAHDPKEGLIVRVNMSHRLYRDVISLQGENVQLMRALDILFFALARGEYNTLYRGEFDVPTTEAILTEYREQVGGQVAEILRQIGKSG
jgi:hypothetical protein